MKTAVDYIKEKLMCNEYWYENMTFDQIIEQAKEMEKEQICDAYYYGIDVDSWNVDNPYEAAEQYYKQTYESKTNI
jgi:glutamate mutase epsilon subunit